MGFTIEDYDLRETYWIARKILFLSGYYPSRVKPNFLIYFSGVLNWTLCCLHFISMTIQIILNFGDILAVAQTIQYYMTHLTFMLKFINFFWYRKEMLEIEDTLKFSIFYHFNEKSLSLLKSKILPCQYMTKFFYVAIVFSASFFTLTPIFGKSGTLAVPAWFPYNTKNHYYVTYLLQIYSFCTIAFIHGSHDIIAWTLMSVSSGQLEILTNNLKNLDYTKEENLVEFIKYVNHHREIKKLVDKIQTAFSKGILAQFFASLIVLCFTGFLLLLVPFGFQFLYFLMYLSCLMCQVVFYCWYGHDVMTTSDKIGISFYLSNWYQSDITIRKTLIIFLQNTQQPIQIAAGRFVTLSLGTLTNILKSSYSYFAVLQHLYNKE